MRALEKSFFTLLLLFKFSMACRVGVLEMLLTIFFWYVLCVLASDWPGEVL